MKYGKYNRGAVHHIWYANGDEWYKEIIDTAVGLVKGKCLDLGCGDGLISKLLKYDVLGVDNNKLGLKYAREKAPKGRYLNANINTLKLKEKFDYMTCINLIEHLENPENVVKIFKKNIDKKAIIVTDRKDKSRPMRGYHVKEFTLKEVKDMFKGFDIKEVKLKDKYSIFLEVIRK